MVKETKEGFSVSLWVSLSAGRQIFAEQSQGGAHYPRAAAEAEIEVLEGFFQQNAVCPLQKAFSNLQFHFFQFLTLEVTLLNPV